jgi:hypothetical protein
MYRSKSCLSSARLVMALMLMLAPVAYAFQYDVLGTLDKSCKLAVGKVHHAAFANTGHITINFQDEPTQCSGTFKMNGYSGKNPLAVKGLVGDAQLPCSDGSTMDATPVADSIRRGHGLGTLTRPDSRKETFYFVFSTHGKDTPNLLQKLLLHKKSGCQNQEDKLIKCITAQR